MRESVGDLFDMSEAQARCTLENLRTGAGMHRLNIAGGIRQTHQKGNREGARIESFSVLIARAGSPLQRRDLPSRAQEPPRVAPRLQK